MTEREKKGNIQWQHVPYAKGKKNFSEVFLVNMKLFTREM